MKKFLPATVPEAREERVSEEEEEEEEEEEGRARSASQLGYRSSLRSICLLEILGAEGTGFETLQKVERMHNQNHATTFLRSLTVRQMSPANTTKM